jgi:hypothetical protein
MDPGHNTVTRRNIVREDSLTLQSLCDLLHFYEDVQGLKIKFGIIYKSISGKQSYHQSWVENVIAFMRERGINEKCITKESHSNEISTANESEGVIISIQYD